MSRRRSPRLVLPATVIVVVLVGCTGASTGPTEAPASPSPTVAPTEVPASPSPTVAPTGPFALRSGPLPRGEYTTTAFEPTLTFTLDDGWQGLFPDDEDEVALEGSDGVFFAITRVSEVVDPTTGAVVAVPGDLIGWLTSHPALMAEIPEPVTIAGVSGQRVDVTVTNGSELEVFAYPGGNMRIPAGVTFRCHVLSLDGADLTIILGAPDATFAEATELIEPILESLVIDAGG